MVENVHSPRRTADRQKPELEASSSTTPASVLSSAPSSSSSDEFPAHKIGGDLKIPTKDANAQDDPTGYLYWVCILELEKERSHEKGKAAAKALVQSGE